jgi:hypothetical protein
MKDEGERVSSDSRYPSTHLPLRPSSLILHPFLLTLTTQNFFPPDNVQHNVSEAP